MLSWKSYSRAALLASVALVALLGACTRTTERPTPVSRSGMSVMLSSQRSDTGRAALDRFVPAVAPVDSGGECAIWPMPAPGVRLLSAAFPTRDSAKVVVSLTVDSTNRILQYSEVRGVVQISGRVTTEEERDSLRAEARRRMRSTRVQLDYVTGLGLVGNYGGGEPSTGVTAPVAAIERDPKFGHPGERSTRVLLLCLRSGVRR